MNTNRKMFIWIVPFQIHPWRQSFVKTVDSDLRIHCYFVQVISGTIYGFNHETVCLILWFNNHTKNEIYVFYIKSWNICTYSVYFKSKKQLNYNRFVDPTRTFTFTNLSNFEYRLTKNYFQKLKYFSKFIIYFLSVKSIFLFGLNPWYHNIK